MDGDLTGFIANIWFFLIGLILVLYVVLDGFDLGVGILSLITGREERRGIMMTSLGSVWDANETWLVLLGGALFGAFPLVYGVVLHALYIPVTLMLFGLIFRGVAFEFYEHSERKAVWGLAFGAGSLVAAATQGIALGALIQGLPVVDREFAGTVWDWVGPFPAMVAVGVVCGYVVLGATYLVLKTEGEVQARSYRQATVAAWLMLAAAVGVTVWTPLAHPYVAQKWFSLPTFYSIAPLPLIAAAAFVMLLLALRRRRERAPFVWSLVIFMASFAGLAMSLYPYMVPPDVTFVDAAASPKTLVFMLTGVGILLPIMLIYNAYQYLVFRGKVSEAGYD